MKTSIGSADFQSYLRVLSKHKKIALIVFLVIVSINMFLSLRKKYVYEAKAKVIIGESVGQKTIGESINDFRNFFYEQQAFATFPYILKSKPVIEEIAKRTGWADPKTDPEQFKSLTRQIKRSITIVREGDSRLFHIQAKNGDPLKAKTLANLSADVFIEKSLQNKLETFKKSLAWLADQLVELEYTLEESQKELIDFIEKERVTSYGGENLTPKPLAGFNESLENQSALFRLQNLKIEQELELARLLQKYTPKHPKVLEIKKALNLTRSKIASENKVAKVESEKIASETIRVKQKEIKYSILKRKVDINKELYNSLIQKMKEIDIASAINDNNITVLEYSETPGRPLHPNRQRQMVMGFLFALVMALGLPFLLDYLDPTIQTAEDVEAFLNLPLLASIPEFSEKVDSVFPSNSIQSTEAEAFRKLRTNIRFAFPSDSGRCLLVTSSGPGEGKSTIATNLARTMASAGLKVCLVDTDLRIPRLHKFFKLPNDRGITDYLVGEENSLDQILQKTDLEHLSVITSGNSTPKPAELLETVEMQKTIQTLTSRFDRVIFDSPPAGNLIDAAVLSVYLDGVIFVLEPGHINKNHIKSAKSQLDRVKANICGVVLNKVVLPKGKSYYYYYNYQRPVSEVDSEKSPPEITTEKHV